jgi:acyl-homoserine-lactone acylase
MLFEDPKTTWDNFIQYKHSTHAEMADRILPDLVKAAEESGTPLAKRAAQVLKDWDGQAKAGTAARFCFMNGRFSSWARRSGRRRDSRFPTI